MLVASRFIYDLASLPRPTDEELDDEIDRLLYISTAEQPNYLVDAESRDQLQALDSEILAAWLNRKFKPVLMMLLLERPDNYQRSKGELCKMKRYDTWVNKFLRPSFVRRHATKRIREFYFANTTLPSWRHATQDLKRLLTHISNHLAATKWGTLLDTDRYTSADVRLYSFLKRIVLGKYHNDGLASHVRLCDPLVNFMRRYAEKNSNIIDISRGDPLAGAKRESSLAADIVRSATIGFGFVLFFMYFRRR